MYNIYCMVYILTGIASILIMSENLNKNKFPLMTTLTTIVIKIIISALTIGLLIFHIYLKCKGVTTFQFIVSRRNKKRKNTVFPQSKAIKLAAPSTLHHGSSRGIYY